MSLGPGSIAFVGYNADGTSNFSFVVLDPISAGTVVNFTTNGWHSDAFYDQEGVISWTASGDLAVGTVVNIDGTATTSPTSNLGDVSYLNGTTMALRASNDTLYAFQGDFA